MPTTSVFGHTTDCLRTYNCFRKSSKATKMKIFLALVAVLAAVGYSVQGDLYFHEELENNVIDNELDPDAMAQNEEQAKIYFEYQNFDKRGQGLLKVLGAPEELKAYARDMASEDVMFNSSVNPEVEDPKRVKRQAGCPHVLSCPHRTYYLYWFLYKNQFCWVPWAWWQRVTYVRCKCKECKPPSPPPAFWQNKKGRCFRSCYQPRVMWAYCYDFKKRVWSWLRHMLYLPQRCTCSFIRKK